MQNSLRIQLILAISLLRLGMTRRDVSRLKSLPPSPARLMRTRHEEEVFSCHSHNTTTTSIMMTSSTLEEVELGHARRPAEENGAPRSDGVWSVDTAVPADGRARICGRRTIIKIVGLAGCLLFVMILAISIRAGRHNESSSVATGESINQNTSVSTTLGPNESQTVSTTPLPTLSPTSSPTTSAASTLYNCEGNKLQNGVKLKTGHYLCDDHKRYRFGMDDSGSLIYADDELNMTEVINKGKKGDYFELLVDGNFTVHNKSDRVVWQEDCSDNVTLSDACFTTDNNEVYDCPFLHLQSDGVIVLNYIDDGMKERNILHIYNLTSCQDHFICSMP